MTKRATHTPGPWELSSGGIWAISPWNARVRIATITDFAPMNGIDALAQASGGLLKPSREAFMRLTVRGLARLNDPKYLLTTRGQFVGSALICQIEARA